MSEMASGAAVAIMGTKCQILTTRLITVFVFAKIGVASRLYSLLSGRSARLQLASA